MRFIVYRESFKVYGTPQGGYFVSYKDKGSDYYSDNWFEAKRYKSIGPCLTKLNIDLSGIFSIDEFFKKYPLTNQAKRENILTSLLENNNQQIQFYFKTGRIEAIDDAGNLVSSDKYLLAYINDQIDKNLKKYNSLSLRYSKSFGDKDSSYINKEVDDKDFWEEVLKDK